MAKVTFQMLVFQQDYVLEQALAALRPYGRVIVTEGPVEYWWRQGDLISTDRTLSILRRSVPKDCVVRGQWAEKDAMMRAAQHLIPPDTTHVWMVDADEVWEPRAIERVLAQLDHWDSVGFKPHTFFGGFERVLTGFEMQAEWIRIQRWHPGAEWHSHRPPTVLAPDGVPYRRKHHWESAERFCHYSYVFPEQVRRKVAYYESWGAGVIEHWFQRVYLPWVMGDDGAKRRVEREFHGVHEWLPARRGDCYTEPFRGQHPASVLAVLPELRARLARELVLVGARQAGAPGGVLA